MKTKVVILLAIFFLLFALSGCVSQPETTAPQPKETIYKIGETIIKGNLSITFQPYTISHEYMSNGQNYTVIIIPIEVKNIGSREEEIAVVGGSIEVDKGYLYEDKKLPDEYYPLSRLNPEDVKIEEIRFSILKGTKPIKIHGQFTIKVGSVETYGVEVPVKTYEIFILKMG